MPTLPAAELSEAYAILREILLDHEVSAELIGELAASGPGTRQREMADELVFTAAWDGAGGLTLSVEAIGNMVRAKIALAGPLDLPLPAEEPGAVFAALWCKGVEDDDIEDKAAYVENMQTLLSTLV